MDTEIDKEYNDVLKNCVFISKPDGWFIEGFQVELGPVWGKYTARSKFKDNSALGTGLTYEGCESGECRTDTEGCSLWEFEIYDKWGNEISDFTLEEYKKLFIRDEKISDIISDSSI